MVVGIIDDIFDEKIIVQQGQFSNLFNMAPIDYITGAGILSSLTIGLGALTFSSLTGVPISSIRTPLKITIMSTSALGGAVCGILGGAVAGFVVSAIGTSGRSNSERPSIILKFATTYGCITGLLGGAAGLGFGAISEQCVYHLLETILENIPRSVLIPAIISLISLSVFSVKGSFTNKSKQTKYAPI